MTLDERTQLVAEEAFLARELARLPAAAKLTRSSLERRLDTVKQQLTAAPKREPRRLAMTFKGEPVEGSRAIEAGFAGKSLSLFSDAHAMFAAGMTFEGLAASGRVPGASQDRLRVVGPAVGSFGFELELPPREGGLFDGIVPTPEEAALDVTLDLLEGALAGDEEALSDLLGQVELRAARKLAEFVKLTADRRAMFAVQSGARRIIVPDLEAARRGAAALGAKDAVQEEVSLRVTLTGLRASKPDFEAQREDTGAILLGSVARGVDVERLRAALDTTITLRFRETRVPNARPRHLLLGFQEDAPQTVARPG